MLISSSNKDFLEIRELRWRLSVKVVKKRELLGAASPILNRHSLLLCSGHILQRKMLESRKKRDKYGKYMEEMLELEIVTEKSAIFTSADLAVTAKMLSTVVKP